MINDFSQRPDFQKEIKQMKPEQVDTLWDCLHSTQCTQQMIDNDKAAAAAAAAKSANMEIHHELPQEFRQQFERAGLDIEKYTKEVPRGPHRLKPDGLHARGPNGWNQEWRKFFAKYPNATKQQILRQLDKMRTEFGLK